MKNEKVLKVIEKLSSQSSSLKFYDHSLMFGFAKQLNWDLLDLYKNGYITADILCKAIITNKYFNPENNLAHYIETNLDVSLDDFLLQNFKLLIELVNEESEHDKPSKESDIQIDESIDATSPIGGNSEIEKTKGFDISQLNDLGIGSSGTSGISGTINNSLKPIGFDNYTHTGDQICDFFIKSFGMNEFIRRFSNFNSFSFLKTINRLASPHSDVENELWGNREIDNILIEYLVNKRLAGEYLVKEIEYNYIPNIPTSAIQEGGCERLCSLFFDTNKLQIIISSTTADLSALGFQAFNHQITNIRQRHCIISSQHLVVSNIIHVCFYNVTYEGFYDSLTLSDVTNLKWNKFIHFNDPVLIAHEDEYTTYPKFYQLLIDNRFKFKKLVTNVLRYDSGIDHYAFTHGSSHKEWLDNYPFQSEDMRLKFKRRNLDSTFNDFFRTFVEIDDQPNLGRLTDIADDLFFYNIK